MNQIVIIHGGMTFKNKKDYLDFIKNRPISLEKKKSWADDIEKKLGKKFQIIRPHMPLKEDATYAEWKIHFEKYLPHLKNNVSLIGSSLGGIFLAKYLSENKFPKKIKGVYLVCPPFEDTLPGEDLTGGFTLKSNLSLLEKNSPRLFLFFAKNDPVVPVAHAKKYQDKLPHAKVIVYQNVSGHFEISAFPDLIKMLKAY